MVRPVQSVERILDILEMLAQTRPGWRITDLAKKLGLKISTAHNLLKTLARRGYVEQDIRTRRYQLGKKSFFLAQDYSRHDLLTSAAAPHLEKLNRLCGDLVFLGVLSNADLVCLLARESRHPLGVSPRQNWRGQSHCTAAGKILLAHCPEDELDLIVKKHGLRKFTARTITRRGALESELDKVRQNGYALVRDEGVEGISALGVPIRDSAAKVIAALSIATPTLRASAARRKQLLNELKTAALRISADLGYVCNKQP